MREGLTGSNRVVFVARHRISCANRGWASARRDGTATETVSSCRKRSVGELHVRKCVRFRAAEEKGLVGNPHHRQIDRYRRRVGREKRKKADWKWVQDKVLGS